MIRKVPTRKGTGTGFDVYLDDQYLGWYEPNPSNYPGPRQGYARHSVVEGAYGTHARAREAIDALIELFTRCR